MLRYYTRVCNFYYGKNSNKKINKRKSIPLNGNKEISFDTIELISRKSRKKIPVSKISSLPLNLKKDVKSKLQIIKRKKIFKNLNLRSFPILMGILNVTPDSFSDGGNFIKKNLAVKHMNYLFSKGADLVDIGGESTRPGSKSVTSEVEWSRIKHIINVIDKKKFISLDTRKSMIMEKGIKLGVKLINDVSGLNYDVNTINILKKYKIPFILQHSLGNPDVMQNKPKYKNVLLDIYDFFEDRISFLRKKGITHNNIIFRSWNRFWKKFET
tara:strand:- start:5599 stop:6408 length:810 start_codon:yes stop_codon:yes gene_type:complete